MSTTFEDVKVGDKVWIMPNGVWATVCGGRGEPGEPSWHAVSESGAQFHFDKNGAMNRSGVQIVFWSKPTIIAPEKPKRKVVKTVEGWMAINPPGTGHGVSRAVCFNQQAAEDQRATNGGRVVKLTGTYEAEE